MRPILVLFASTMLLLAACSKKENTKPASESQVNSGTSTATKLPKLPNVGNFIEMSSFSRRSYPYTDTFYGMITTPNLLSYIMIDTLGYIYAHHANDSIIIFSSNYFIYRCSRSTPYLGFNMDFIANDSNYYSDSFPGNADNGNCYFKITGDSMYYNSNVWYCPDYTTSTFAGIKI